MAMDILSTLHDMATSGDFVAISRNPLAQFGRNRRQYLGATLLPERMVMENAFREESIRYRTVIANAGTRYSPVQKKGANLVGAFEVILAESDIGSEFSGRDYDALLRILAQAGGGTPSMEAVAQITRWLDSTVNLPLVEVLELWRWQAIVSAAVTLTGSNGYNETVSYSNPTNHRAAQTANWSTDSTDVFEDIHTMADLLASKGYTVNRMITSRTVLAKMAGNDTVKSRVGVAVVNASGQIAAAAGRATMEAINGALNADGLPPIELYDLQYRTSTSTGYFLPRDVFVLVGTTGRDEAVDLGDSEVMVNDTLGYTAVGRAVGQSMPGRHIMATPKDNKPPRIEGEGWQTALPVITEPEAIAVINSIA